MITLKWFAWKVRMFVLIPALASFLIFTPSLLAQSSSYYIVLDLSTSTEASPQWTAAAEQQIFSQLQFGDKITILPVRGSDLLSAPLLDETIPIILPSDGLKKTMEAKQKRKAVREAGRAVIASALATQPRSNATALIATFGRVRVGNRTRILVLSDALESTKQTVDLERTAVTQENVSALVAKALKGAMLPHGIAGAEVGFVLPGNLPKVVPANSAPQLRLFWDLAIRSLHGTLTSLDSQIIPWK